MQRTIVFMLALLGSLFPLAGCRFNYATESMDAIILYRGTPVTVEAFGHGDGGHGLGYINPESHKCKLRVEDYADICEFGGQLPKGFPKTILMVIVSFEKPKGPEAEAYSALASLYPDGDPTQQVAIFLSLEPIILAVAPRDSVPLPRFQFGADSHEMLLLFGSGKADREQTRLFITLVTEELLDITVDSIIEIPPDGEPTRTEVEKTVRALMCERANTGEPGVFRRNRGWRDD